MAIVLEPSPNTPALPGGSGALLPRPTSDPGVIRRPVESTKGIVSWITTVDHKRIGIMYGALSLVWFVIGGIEALLIRLQLAAPNGEVIGADTYNQMFTMHGTTMVFLVVMPLSSAFFNYFLPLQIGARDVAFPRLNALSWWLYVFGGLFLYSSFFLGGAPNGGWFGYAPNTSITFSPGHNIDFWIFGLQILGIGYRLGGELHRHDHQHACPRNDPVPHAGVHLDDVRCVVPHALRDADHHRGVVLVDVRPQLRRQLLQPRPGW